MNYVLTGGAGHITRPLAEALLDAGHTVTVIGRNAEHLQPLVQKGAKAAVGSVDDAAFLKKAFAGADAAYTMVPPIYGVSDWKAYIESIARNYADAISANGIRYVVNLSSVGAHAPEGCGPVSGLYRAEHVLDALTDVNVRHLRPGFFYYNFMNSVDMVKNAGIIGGNYGGPDNKMVFSDPRDIAEVAAAELLQLSFTGKSVRYIASDERSFGEVARILGAAVQKPSLPWVEFSDEQSLQGMLGAGLPEEIARNYTEMGAAIRQGKMQEDYHKNPPARFGRTKLEDFAQVFASAF